MNEPSISHVIRARELLSSTPQAWAEVARGFISAEEAARRLHGREPTELIERSKALFNPPSLAQREALFEQLLAAGVDRGGHEREPPAGTRWWLVPTLSFALAAGLLLLLRSPMPPPAPATHSLPSYTVEFEYGIATMRDIQDPMGYGSMPTYLLDRDVLVRLVPDEPVDEMIEVVAFARSAGGRVTRLQMDSKISAEGVVELEGRARDIGLDLGEWELVLAVGPRSKTPVTWQHLVASEFDGGQRVVMRSNLRIISSLDESLP